MPELVFKGKEFVYNHHLTVPFRPLEPHPDKSIGDVRLDGNLIIHGDNLHALKALLPMYAGRVDCIFIDPPYNTGNEGWCYNDNVNSPVIQEWLNNNPVGIEDGLRHDKWCAMMWPRLRLLYELLTDDGILCITLDDNEAQRGKLMLDEIFGENNFLANVSWVKRYTRSNNARMFYSMKDAVIIYRKTSALCLIKEPRSQSADSIYSNPDNDPRGPWMTSSYVNPATREQRQNLCYPIEKPNGEVVEHPTHAWKYSIEEHKRHKSENLLWWGNDGNALYPRLKLFLRDANLMVPVDVWDFKEVGSSDDGGNEVKKIFGSAVFDNPKPTKLVQKVLSLIPKGDAIVMDSFAGSGTTAHAVLATNALDNGNRRFILVECEEYADKITAERMRRVINGYPFIGKYCEELLREKITWTKFRRASETLQRIDFIEATEAKRFDTIKKSLKDGELIVVGEKSISEKMDGLGGEFTFCTLGDPIDFDQMLTGESLPSFEALGSALFHTATNRPVDTSQIDVNPLDLEGVGYLGASESLHVWLIYKPELDFLKSRDAALTLAKAEAIKTKAPDGRHLVFAPARFVSQKMLNEANLPVEFAPLPFALYRIERGSQS